MVKERSAFAALPLLIDSSLKTHSIKGWECGERSIQGDNAYKKNPMIHEGDCTQNL